MISTRRTGQVEGKKGKKNRREGDFLTGSEDKDKKKGRKLYTLASGVYSAIAGREGRGRFLTRKHRKRKKKRASSCCCCRSRER